MTLLRRLSGMFGGAPEPARDVEPEAPTEAPVATKSAPQLKAMSHRERLKDRGDDDITARFALAFDALEASAVKGVSELQEVAHGLVDESAKLKQRLGR